MKRILIVLVLGAAVVACQDLNLKTRDDLRGDSKPQPAKPAETAGQPVEVATPPPDKQDEIDAQMRQLNGRVDEVENQVNQTNAVIQNVKEQNGKDKEAQGQKIAALEESVKKLEASLQAVTEQLNKKPADPDAMLKDADALMAAKKDKEAIVAYQKYRDAFPKGSHYGEVTFKIGTCFQGLGMKDEARAFYEEVINKFPKSKDAKAAAKRLKTLK